MKGARARAGVALLLAVPLACASCSRESADKPEGKAQAPLTGWKSLKFGMSLSDALAAIPQITWNAYGMNECAKVMATDGCFLTADEASGFAPEDGISFRPLLSFNKFGKLTDVGLEYEQSDRVTRAECLELHERTLDRLTREIGELRFADGANPKTEEGATREVRRTPGGNRYALWSKKDGRSFVTDPLRSHFQGVRFPTSATIVTWNDKAFASLLSVFITVDGSPMCMINVNYETSPKVPRRKMES